MSDYIIIGVADTHLRDTQYGYPSRGLDFSSSLERIVDTAINEKKFGRNIAAILHAGDLLDNTRPSPAIIKFLNKLHSKLIQARLAMYVISGNHDRTFPHWTEILEEGHDVFDAGIICADHKLIRIPLGPKHHVNVYGLPFCQKADLAVRLETEVPKKDVDILMWHGAVQEFVKFPMESAITLDELPKNRFQAILVGDIHVTQTEYLNDDGTIVISPGSTEMCKSDEPLQKNIMELHFSTKEDQRMDGAPHLAQVIPVPIKTRKYLTYKLVTEDDVTNCLQEIKEHLADNPVIMVRSHSSLPNVLSRFNVVVDRDKCILKLGNLPTSKMEVVGIVEPTVKVKPVDHLHNFLPPGTKLFELGQLMTDPEVNEKDALEQYCAGELDQIIT